MNPPTQPPLSSEARIQHLARELEEANFRLNQKLVQLETLYEAGLSFGATLQVEDVIGEFLPLAVSMVDARSGFLFLKDQQSGRYALVQHINLALPQIQALAQSSVRAQMRRVTRNSTPRHLDAKQVPDAVQGSHMLLVPVGTAGCIGFIDKESRLGVQPFSEADGHLLEMMGRQAGTALANAQLYRQILEEKNLNQSIIRSIATGVLTTDLAGTILLTNPAAQDIFKDHHLQPGKSGPHFFRRAGLKKIAAAIKKAQADGQEHQLRDQTARHDLILNVRINSLRNHSGQSEGLVITLENLTEATQLRTRFKQYTSDQVADYVLAPDASPALGGQQRQATMLFVDISGSTELLGSIGADEMVSLLNRFFTSMVDIIYAHQGILDKYTGDGFLAVWGVPQAIDDANQRALVSALAICREMELLIKESGHPLGVKCGISCGQVLAGNIGSLRRMEYTVIGPDVNLASRLCDRASSGQILVSPSLYADMKNRYDFKSLGGQFFKGNRIPLEVYQVLDPKDTRRPVHAAKGPSTLPEDKVRIDLNLPMMADMEFAASHTLQAIGVLMDMAEDKIEEIKLALIEACINAIEHSQSKESRLQLGFELSQEALTIIISDRGHGFDVKKALITAGQRQHSGQLKRGWGLHLMQEFMDEFDIESDRDGTTITLKKYC